MLYDIHQGTHVLHRKYCTSPPNCLAAVINCQSTGGLPEIV